MAKKKKLLCCFKGEKVDGENIFNISAKVQVKECRESKGIFNKVDRENREKK